MGKKIALIGSAPSSIRFAPYADETWDIWVCSPGAYPVVSVTRPNAWFEIHRWEPPNGYTGPKTWFTPEYIAYMARLQCPVYMIHPVPEIPNSVAYPKDEILTRFAPFAPYFMTSTLSWMFAKAIADGATEIGLWGVDMSANEEWAFQRSGCHFWIALAKSMGIKVTIPPESDLDRPPTLYGFREVDPMHIKLLSRKEELKARMGAIVPQVQQLEAEHRHLAGALDNLEYVMQTWVADQAAVDLIFQGSRISQEQLAEAVETVKTNGLNGHAAETVQ